MIHDDPNAVILGMAPPGYVMTHVHRQTSILGKINHGGGFAIIFHDNFKVKCHPSSSSFKPSSFKIQVCNIADGKVAFTLVNIYR